MRGEIVQGDMSACHISRLIYNKPMNGKAVIAKLKAAGWRVARIEGSHHIMQKDGMPRAVPVPVHGSKDLGPGLLAAIQRQSGVKLK
jgi:predicted RNA binding protein YcfA (HicA-like mRNA interferase family)